jgi:hypothetical protein
LTSPIKEKLTSLKPLNFVTVFSKLCSIQFNWVLPYVKGVVCDYSKFIAEEENVGVRICNKLRIEIGRIFYTGASSLKVFTDITT